MPVIVCHHITSHVVDSQLPVNILYTTNCDFSVKNAKSTSSWGCNVPGLAQSLELGFRLVLRCFYEKSLAHCSRSSRASQYKNSRGYMIKVLVFPSENDWLASSSIASVVWQYQSGLLNFSSVAWWSWTLFVTITVASLVLLVAAIANIFKSKSAL